MTNLIDLQTQIEKLQKQANEIKSKERQKTILEIQQQMRAFGITLKDLQKVKPKAKPGKPIKPAKVKSVVAAKYRGPNGETWSGRGLPPKWLAALIAEGKTKESFLI